MLPGCGGAGAVAVSRAPSPGATRGKRSGWLVVTAARPCDRLTASELDGQFSVMSISPQFQKKFPKYMNRSEDRTRREASAPKPSLSRASSPRPPSLTAPPRPAPAARGPSLWPAQAPSCPCAPPAVAAPSSKVSAHPTQQRGTGSGVGGRAPTWLTSLRPSSHRESENRMSTTHWAAERGQ